MNAERLDTLYVGGWIVGSSVVVGLLGIEWASTTVQIPVGWVLVLTFVPTLNLVRVVNSYLRRIETAPKDQSADQPTAGDRSD